MSQVLWIGPLLVTVLMAAAIAVGARMALSPRVDRGERASYRLTRLFAFGTGAFLVAVCLDFLPDAWHSKGGPTAWWIFAGAMLPWFASVLSDGWFEQHQPTYASDTAAKFRPMAALVVAGSLSFHTFLEGTAVAATFHEFGWSTLAFSIAVILHKLPEGVLWAFALTAVFPNDRRLIIKVLSIPAACTLLGAMLGVEWGEHWGGTGFGTAMAVIAGALLYIAFAELLPALRESVLPKVSRYWFLLGILVMILLNGAVQFFGGA